MDIPNFSIVTRSCHDVLCCDNKKRCNLILRLFIITTSCGCFNCINRHSVTRWLKKCFWVFQWSRLRRVHQEQDLFFRVTKIYSRPTLWDYIQCCNTVTRSRGWNIAERVNGNIGNEIELGMEIPMIRSWILQVAQKQREYDIDVCGSTMKVLCQCTGIIMAILVPLMIIHRRGVSVMPRVFLNRRVIHLRVQWHVRCFWYIQNCRSIDRRETKKFSGDSKFEGFQKEFRNNGD
jgi:hypothetical protein